MKRITLLSGLACLVFGSSLAQGQTHCHGNERVVFSCSMQKKTASVCASEVSSPSQGYLQYRFGVLGKVEMEYPKVQQHPQGKFTTFYGTPIMDDGSRAMIASIEFGVSDYGYELITTALNDTSETELVVSRAGKTLATLMCRPGSVLNPDMSSMGILSTFGLN